MTCSHITLKPTTLDSQDERKKKWTETLGYKRAAPECPQWKMNDECRLIQQSMISLSDAIRMPFVIALLITPTTPSISVIYAVNEHHIFVKWDVQCLRAEVECRCAGAKTCKVADVSVAAVSRFWWSTTLRKTETAQLKVWNSCIREVSLRSASVCYYLLVLPLIEVFLSLPPKNNRKADVTTTSADLSRKFLIVSLHLAACSLRSRPKRLLCQGNTPYRLPLQL